MLLPVMWLTKCWVCLRTMDHRVTETGLGHQSLAWSIWVLAMLKRPNSIPVQDSQFVIGSLRLTLASQQKILTHVCSPKCAGTDCWSPPVALEILKTLPKWAPILMGFDCCTCIPQGFAPVEHKITDQGLRTCGMTQKFSRTAI